MDNHDHKNSHDHHDHAGHHSHKMNHKEEHGSHDHGKMDHHDHGGHMGHNPGHGEMGHDHHRMMIEDFKKRFWVSLVLTIPILAFSPMIQGFFGYEWLLPGNPYILFVLSSIVYF